MTHAGRPRKVAVDYKGKHFILMDENIIENDSVLSTYIDGSAVVESRALLAAHVADCLFYGIPPYIGEDNKLRALIDELQDEIETAYTEEDTDISERE